MKQKKNANADRPESTRLWEEACKYIPGGTNTNSKRVSAFGGTQCYPAYIERAAGAYVVDIDGNRYIDYVAALAPIVLGYNHPKVNSAIASQLEKGILFSLPPIDELTLSKTLVDAIPCAEMVKLLKSGAEATSAAVRLARHYTRRELVLSCGYNGWHDWSACSQTFAGIPKSTRSLTKSFGFNDVSAAQRVFEQYGDAAACLVVTPAIYGRHPAPGFLEALREMCSRQGLVLVFDEIITGFRWSLGGAQETYGVTPDLATFAKGIANGMPLSALVGRADIMSLIEDNWVTSTYASESLSIVAALETIDSIKREKAIERIHDIARQLRNGLRDIGRAHGVEIDVGDDVPVVRFEFVAAEGEMTVQQDNFIKNCSDNGVLIRKDGPGFSLCPMAAVSDTDIQESLSVFEYATSCL